MNGYLYRTGAEQSNALANEMISIKYGHDINTAIDLAGGCKNSRVEFRFSLSAY